MTVSDYENANLHKFFIDPPFGASSCFRCPQITGLPLVKFQPHLYKYMNRYTYIGYSKGGIVYNKLLPDRPIGISAYFTGCAMAYFELVNKGAYIAHIALTEGEGDQRNTWNTFVLNNRTIISKYAIFRPFKAKGTISKYTQDWETVRTWVVGIINPLLECYAYVVDKEQHAKISIEYTYPEKHSCMELNRQADIQDFLIPPHTAGTLW